MKDDDDCHDRPKIQLDKGCKIIDKVINLISIRRREPCRNTNTCGYLAFTWTEDFTWRMDICTLNSKEIKERSKAKGEIGSLEEQRPKNYHKNQQVTQEEDQPKLPGDQCAIPQPPGLDILFNILRIDGVQYICPELKELILLALREKEDGPVKMQSAKSKVSGRFCEINVRGKSHESVRCRSTLLRSGKSYVQSTDGSVSVEIIGSKELNNHTHKKINRVQEDGNGLKMQDQKPISHRSHSKEERPMNLTTMSSLALKKIDNLGGRKKSSYAIVALQAVAEGLVGPDIAYCVSVVTNVCGKSWNNMGSNEWHVEIVAGTANVSFVIGQIVGQPLDRNLATLQHVVALSTTEAEYMASRGCGKAIVRRDSWKSGPWTSNTVAA
ncbi:hypothetical protein Tco_0907720 [Tanacetum coccineum]|uniref:Uncharacterized protein n=1 Tax=Tanacetum coccineum TaxID=301880 RepID=A0ABQ5CL86_9ASTR